MKEGMGKILNFLAEADNLKSVLRFGSAKKMVGDSSAAHSWELSLMVFIVAKDFKIDLDVEKSLKIAIVHDLAESVTGDIDHVVMTDGGVSKKEEKKKAERKAMREITSKLPKESGEEIFALWDEYEAGSTREAKFVKALDKLETITYLIELGHEVYDRPEIIPTYADKAVESFPELKDLLREIKKRLKVEFIKGDLPWKKEYDKHLL